MSSPTPRANYVWETNGGDDILQIKNRLGSSLGGIDVTGAGFGALAGGSSISNGVASAGETPLPAGVPTQLLQISVDVPAGNWRTLLNVKADVGNQSGSPIQFQGFLIKPGFVFITGGGQTLVVALDQSTANLTMVGWDDIAGPATVLYQFFCITTGGLGDSGNISGTAILVPR
jgi:hypothetical protein